MAGSNADLVRSAYGYNWIAVDERERGLTATAAVLAPDVEARISPEIGDRVLHGIEEFAVFVEGLEQDFSEFRYDPDDVVEPSADRVVVVGRIRVRGRQSNMPLTAHFGHLWTFRDGKAVSVEAHLEPGEAFAAAG